MQARRGFILFPIGKPARGLGLIRMRLLKMVVLVIKQGLTKVMCMIGAMCANPLIGDY
jgi:hypothetical protein